MTNPSVCAILDAQYGISVRPGQKVNCPFCGHHTFSVKRDDTLAKCFHPACAKFVSCRETEAISLTGVLMEIYHDWHQELLQLKDAPYHSAYQYLNPSCHL